MLDSYNKLSTIQLQVVIKQFQSIAKFWQFCGQPIRKYGQSFPKHNFQQLQKYLQLFKYVILLARETLTKSPSINDFITDKATQWSDTGPMKIQYTQCNLFIYHRISLKESKIFLYLWYMPVLYDLCSKFLPSWER